jgi:UDP-3-O-[3-hydroxymyristoyl] N-acetylglucosamine deacetylase
LLATVSVVRNQRTIGAAIEFEGVGLHTGKHCKVSVLPAKEDTGIVIVRVDRDRVIIANVGAVAETAFATTLGQNGTRVKTVEHLLAAFYGLGIDNVIVEVEGPEIPILDGSSAPIVEKLLEAGIVEQKRPKPYIQLKEPIIIEDSGVKVAGLPYDGFRVCYTINFRHPLFSDQKLEIDITPETFVREIAPARTFGFLKHVQYLKANNLALGGSLECAVVVDEERVLNPEGLRFSDEFVRHKVLDLVGDFSLLGYPIRAHIIAEKAGHSSHVKFIKSLLENPSAWEIVGPVKRSLQKQQPTVRTEASVQR